MANGLLPLLRYLHRMAAGGSGGDLSDGQLLERFVRQHDEAAFAVLLERHARMVWGVCSRILRDSHQAEDAFQATFLVFVRKAAAIAQGERLANWLYGVAMRVAKRARTQPARRLVHQEEVPDMPSQDLAHAPGWSDLSAVLDEEVRRLPCKYREPLVLCYLEGMTNGEAARQLRCPEGTVVTWLARGREKLRQRLQRRGMVLPAAALTALLADAASAAVPAGIVDSTLTLTHALLVAGQKTTFGLASASVASLTEGVLHDMVLMKLKIAGGLVAAALVLAASGWLVQQALANKPPELLAEAAAEPAVAQPAPADKAPRASKLDLTPESLAKFQALIRPADNEWRHVRIRWLTDVVAARKKAAQEDKPLFIFRTGGAGYNDPLGVC
jgi:RNA polymerase sigma factor (sigma-70 family)